MNHIHINSLRRLAAQQSGLIHCITNPISINQCANAILAVGCSPMMAEHPAEVAQITPTAKALVLNLGNITDVRMQSMEISAATAVASGVPVVVDMVGISCSDLRRKFIYNLIEKYSPQLIKGNYSEINALYNSAYTSAGVDADTALTTAAITAAAQQLAEKYHTMVLASGRVDIVTDGVHTYHISNGVPQLARITGTGCLLGALCGAYISAQQDISAPVTACAVLGICGQLARTDKGNGTFFVNLMDALSTLSDEDVEKYLQLEEV